MPAFARRFGSIPENTDCQSSLGYALSKQEKFDEAIIPFREAIRLKADDSDLHLNLGYALECKGQLDEAVARYREASRLAPKAAQPLSFLGSALLQQGKYVKLW